MSDAPKLSPDLIPEIFYEDTHLCVLSKPPGLLSQRDISEVDSLVDWLQFYFGRHYVGLVHRLDRNTSGLMVVGKRSKAADRLSAQLREGTLLRKYHAWVLDPQGQLPETLTLRHQLIKNERTNEVRAIEPNSRTDHPGADRAKQAVLNLRKLRTGKLGGLALALVEVKLETGRSHQIRAQLQAAGFPLLGDRKYAPANPDLLRQSMGFHRPALHSCYLEFRHPMTQTQMIFESLQASDWPFASGNSDSSLPKSPT